MLRPIDDFLIDRVFQKIADALCRWRSCYGIAAFLLTGGAATLFAIAVFLAASERAWAFLLLAPLFGLWLWFMPARAYSLDAAWQRGKEALPVDRIRDIGLRCLWLVLWPLFAVTLAIGAQPSAMLMLNAAAWGSFTFGLYFLACAPKRPRRQTARQLAWMASR